MPNIRVDQQGRLVLPRQIRRRLGIDGRAGQLWLVETPDGFLLAPPPAAAIVSDGDDGLPVISLEGLAAGDIKNEAVLEAIDADRAAR